MINFDEEIKKFQPSLEVDDADIFVAMMKESQDNTGDKK